MTDDQHNLGPSRTLREQLVRDILDTVDERHGGRGHRGFNHFLGSLRRICNRAEGMLESNQVWRAPVPPSSDRVADVVFDEVRDSEREYRRARRGETPPAQRAPLPELVVAEQLIAKTLATFADSATVRDLFSWTERAEATIARPERAGRGDES